MPKKKKTAKKIIIDSVSEFDLEKIEEVRQKLKLKALLAKGEFEEKFTQANEVLKEKGLDVSSLRFHSARLLAAGALASTLAFVAPNSFDKLIPDPPQDIIARHNTDNGDIPAISKATKLRNALYELLPSTIRPLNDQEEKYIEKVVSEMTGVPVRATLEGEHLNTVYGKIGAEQHLRRYPGDVNANHMPEKDEYGGDRPAAILKEGIAPGLGAWGYFAKSKEELTPDLVETEKWYSVAQTLYLPDWNTRQPYLKNWYKHRKLLIVNTDNGKAVVTALADSGPAAFTGKHFGGSPEVMDYLGGERYKKGPVLVLFVDDPNNEIPLGPVEYNDATLALFK